MSSQQTGEPKLGVPCVAVVIPTYDHADLVPRTVESVLAQTYTDFELILVNDGSPDGTAEVLARFLADPRVRYIEQPNGGPAAARNRGLQEARAPYVALLDDDDLWPPDKLEWQVAYLEDHPDAGVVAGTASIIDADNRNLSDVPLPGRCTWRSLFAGCPFVSPGQTLIRRAVLAEVGGFDPDLWGADDWDLWLRLARRTEIATVDRGALLYRKHATNAHLNRGRMLQNSLRVVKEHLVHAAADERPALQRAAFEFAMNYAGTRLLRQGMDKIGRAEWRSGWRDLWALRVLFDWRVSDFYLVRRLFTDLLPQEWRRRLKSTLPVRGSSHCRAPATQGELP